MNVKLLVMDVDGTLTDGHIYVGAQGEVMKAFDVRDGYAIAHLLPAHGIVPVIISDKLEKLKTIAAAYGASADEIAYIGDDLNDLPCINYCGTTACPADAVPQVLEVADYVCSHNGGRGAVREFIDRILDV